MSVRGFDFLYKRANAFAGTAGVETLFLGVRFHKPHVKFSGIASSRLPKREEFMDKTINRTHVSVRRSVSLLVQELLNG